MLGMRTSEERRKKREKREKGVRERMREGACERECEEYESVARGCVRVSAQRVCERESVQVKGVFSGVTNNACCTQ